MSTIIDAPTLSSLEKQTGNSEIDDEKPAYNERDPGVVAVADLINPGGVFEDDRAIDLDASGKERPIGTFMLISWNLQADHRLGIGRLQKRSKITLYD
jgi:hypothetical protein